MTLGLQTPSPTADLQLRFQPRLTVVSSLAPLTVVEELVDGRGRRWGRCRLLLVRHRGPSLTLQLPPACRVLEARVEGSAVPVYAPDGSTASIPLPPVLPAQPRTVDIYYETLVPANFGAFGQTTLNVPHLEDTAAVRRVFWTIRTTSAVLLMPTDSDAQPYRFWPFYGFLGTPQEAWTRGQLEDLLTQAAPDAPWSTADWWKALQRQDAGRDWCFTTATLDGLRLRIIRHAYWILLCSGSLTVAWLVLRLYAPIVWERALVVFGLGMAATTLFGALFAWLWLGLQWGVLLLAPLIWLEWRARRRLPFPHAPLAESLSFSPSSFLTRHYRPPTPAEVVLASTASHRADHSPIPPGSDSSPAAASIPGGG